MRFATQTDPGHEHQLPHQWMWFTVMLTVMLLLLSAMVRADAMITTSGRIAAAPEHFYGQEVELPRAEVRSAKCVHVFTLAENPTSLHSDIVVLIPTPALDGVHDNEQVAVVGTVRIYNVREFERDYPWYREADFKADENLLLNRPVLVASSVRTAEGTELVLSGR